METLKTRRRTAASKTIKPESYRNSKGNKGNFPRGGVSRSDFNVAKDDLLQLTIKLKPRSLGNAAALCYSNVHPLSNSTDLFNKGNAP